MNNTKILRILAIILALSIFSYWLVISQQTYATDQHGVITKPIPSIYTLVQGSPTSMLIPYPVETMILKNQTLGDSVEIASVQLGPRFIQSHHTENLLIMGKTDDFGLFKGQYIHLDNPNQVKSFSLQTTNFYAYMSSHLLNKDDELIFMIIVGTGTPEKIGFQAKGYSLTKEQPVVVTMADVKYAQIYGSPGGNFRSADPLRGVFANGNKAIFNYYKKLDLGWTYPDDFIMQERESIYLAINNQFIRAFSSPQLVKKQLDGQLVSELKIQNKQTGQWSSTFFNGNANGFRAFGPWIAAEEGYSGADRKYTTSYDGKYESAANRFQIYDYRLTGTLYLAHAIDKRFITFDTHEQDSEILLVDHDRVFYRAGDELYGADIQGNSLVNNQLLVKDKRIVDVHWMMASGKK